MIAVPSCGTVRILVRHDGTGRPHPPRPTWGVVSDRHLTLLVRSSDACRLFIVSGDHPHSLA
jgi:hypothetical protein